MFRRGEKGANIDSYSTSLAQFVQQNSRDPETEFFLPDLFFSAFSRDRSFNSQLSDW